MQSNGILFGIKARDIQAGTRLRSGDEEFVAAGSPKAHIPTRPHAASPTFVHLSGKEGRPKLLITKEIPLEGGGHKVFHFDADTGESLEHLELIG